MILTCYHCYCPLIIAWDRSLGPTQGANIRCGNCGAEFTASFDEIHGPTRKDYRMIAGHGRVEAER